MNSDAICFAVWEFRQKKIMGVQVRYVLRGRRRARHSWANKNRRVGPARMGLWRPRKAVRSAFNGGHFFGLPAVAIMKHCARWRSENVSKSTT